MSYPLEEDRPPRLAFDVAGDAVALGALKLIVPRDLLVGVVVAVEDLPILSFDVAVAHDPVVIVHAGRLGDNANVQANT